MASRVRPATEGVIDRLDDLCEGSPRHIEIALEIRRPQGLMFGKAFQLSQAPSFSLESSRQVVPLTASDIEIGRQ